MTRPPPVKWIARSWLMIMGLGAGLLLWTSGFAAGEGRSCALTPCPYGGLVSRACGWSRPGRARRRQIVNSVGPGIEHIASAHHNAELKVLKTAARSDLPAGR